MKQRDKKQRVHDWLMKRARDPKPLPSQKVIKRELGLELLEAAREERVRRGTK